MHRVFHPLFLLALCAALLACQTEPREDERSSLPMVLDYQLAAPPTTLDPLLVEDPTSRLVVDQLFEGLTQLDPHSAEPLPALALAWDVSGDGFIYTFRLHEGLRWVDATGAAQRELVAEDVVYGIKRACAPGVMSPQRAHLFVIKGCREVSQSEGIPDLDRVGVRAIDHETVEFTLAQEAPYFPALLALPVARPVPAELIEQWGSGWATPERLLSSGPYYLVPPEQAAERLTLLRNPLYHAVQEVAIERVVLHLSAEPEEALARYQEGGLDYMTLPARLEGSVQAMDPPRPQLSLLSQPCTYSYGFTIIKHPVDNARVRRALSLAIDRAWLADQPQEAAALPAHRFVPLPTFGAPSTVEYGLTFDLELARRLLAEAGYPDGLGFPAITLLHPAGPPHAQVAEAVAQMWEQGLQIEVQLQAASAESYPAAIRATRPLAEAPHVWMFDWCAELPDAHSWLGVAFAVDTEADRVGTAPNPFRRTISRFDELIGQAATERLEEPRTRAYEEAERWLIQEQVLLAPLYHPADVVLHQPWLTFAPSNGLVGVRFATWRVDMAAKTAATVPAEDIDQE